METLAAGMRSQQGRDQRTSGESILDISWNRNVPELLLLSSLSNLASQSSVSYFLILLGLGLFPLHYSSHPFVYTKQPRNKAKKKRYRRTEETC